MAASTSAARDVVEGTCGPAGYVFRWLAILLPPIAVLMPKGMVPALFLAVFVLIGLSLTRRIPPPKIDWPVAAGLGLLVLWTGASLSWALPGTSVRSVLSLAGLFTGGLVLVGWARRLRTGDGDAAVNGLGTGLVLGLAVYAFEFVSGNWITRTAHGWSWHDIIGGGAGGINVAALLINGTAILSLLLWPTTAALRSRGRGWLALLLAAGVVAAVAAFGSRTGMIALGVGAVVWTVTTYVPHTSRALAVLFAAIILATPWVAQRTLVPVDLPNLVVETREAPLPSSVTARLFIWKFAAQRIAERPVLGWGFDASRHIGGGGEKYLVRDAENRVLAYDFYMPLHPHNQILQIWLELGALGAVIVAGLGALVIARLNGPALALAGSTFVYAFASFGAWQNWWVAAVLLTISFSVASRNRRDTGLDEANVPRSRRTSSDDEAGAETDSA